MELYNRIVKLRYIPALIVGFVVAIPGNLLNKLLHSSSKVFLVGENGGHGFQDNGKYVFEELLKEKAGQTYWMTSEIHDYIDLNRQCRIGSVKGYYYYFRSGAVFYTHSLSTDIAPLANRVTLFSPLRVEISHGVEGFKRKIKTTQVTNFPADLYTCSNSLEKSIKHNEWNISNSKLLLTGVARYDGLVAGSRQKKSSLQILYMPTWREWNYEDDYEQFKNSKTFQAIRQVCTSSDLEAVLVRTHSNLIVRLHPFFQKYFSQFDLSEFQPHVSLSDADVSQLIHQSDMLVTDYSSVAWDFLYSLKPVAFYQFDRIRYMQERGSYLSMPDDLFGPSTTDFNQFSGIVDKMISTPNIESLKAERKKYFDFVDTNNSSRIVSMTMSRLG